MKIQSIFFLIFCLLCSCTFSLFREQTVIENQAEKIKGNNSISAKELKTHLNNYEVLFRRSIEDASLELAKKNKDESVSAKITEWKMRSLATSQKIFFQENIVLAFLEAGIYAMQLHNFFKDNRPHFFGDVQPIAISATEKLEKKAISLGNKLTHVFPQVQKEMSNFAEENPLSDLFIGNNITSDAGFDVESFRDNEAFKAIYSMIRLPLAPIITADSFNSIAQEFSSFNDNNVRLLKTVDYMPNEVRSQAELLLHNLDNYKHINTIIKGLDKVSQSSVDITKVATKLPDLPQEIRKEAVILLEESMAKKQELQAILKSVEQASSAFGSAGNEWEETISTLGKTLDNLQGEPTKKKDETPGKPFDINEYTQSLIQLQKSAQELDQLIQNVESLLVSQEVPENIKKINESIAKNIMGTVSEAKTEVSSTISEAQTAINKTVNEAKITIDHTSNEIKEIIDYTYKRLLVLSIVIFVLFTVYAFIRYRLRKKNTTI